MDLKLTGRTALVTGSSKGIGASVARWFAREGVNVCLVSRSKAALEKEADIIRGLANVKVHTFATDLSNPSALEDVAAAFPEVDILVNNAGGIPGGTLLAVDQKAWRAGWELKVHGYIGLTRLYLERMKARRSGVVINVIGAAGERLDHSYIAGTTGNAALIAFTRSVGGNSSEFGVRVVGVNPGPVLTDRIETMARQRAASALGDEERWRESFSTMPFGRPATPDEISAMVVFLASDLSSYTSGTVVTIDGGLTYRNSIS